MTYPQLGNGASGMNCKCLIFSCLLWNDRSALLSCNPLLSLQSSPHPQSEAYFEANNKAAYYDASKKANNKAAYYDASKKPTSKK
jgi:hypothetical protein